MSKNSKKSQYSAPPGGDDDGDGEPMSGEDRYLWAEFMAMAKDKDCMLTTAEFIQLLKFLGYADQSSARKIIERVNKDRNSYITIDEYFDALKNDSTVMKGTNRLRKIFHTFDKNLDGSASREDIYKEYKNMGFTIDKEFKEKVDKLDLNKDGKVKYLDFVRAELEHKGII